MASKYGHEWKYHQADWSVMVKLRRADGSIVSIPRAFLEGHFPEGTFKISRRVVRYVDGVGYLGNSYKAAAREVKRAAEVEMVLASMK